MRQLARFAASAAVVAGGLAVTPSPVGAWPNDPHVTLQGRALCGGRPATWVWVESSNGERGWATQPGGNYEFRFEHAPTTTMTVTVKLGITGWECIPARFGVNRPAIGTTATRHVNQIH
jgi:hypothetical protein